MTLAEDQLAVAIKDLIGVKSLGVYNELVMKAERRAAPWKLLEQVNQYLGHLQDSLEGTPHATAIADVVGDMRKALTGLAEKRPAFKRYYAFNGNIHDRR